MAGIEIDLVALNEDERRIRFGSCKRNADKLVGSLPALKLGAETFLATQKKYSGWRVEFVAIAPVITESVRGRLAGEGVIPQSLSDLIAVYQSA